MPGEQLHAIDDALVRLRRLWSPAQQAVVDDRGRRIEMSSVLVVEACARGAGRAGTEVGVGDIAAFAAVEHSTASRLVERAEQAGLVRRVRSATDARRTVVQLTPDGQQVREHAVAFRLGWLESVMAGWGPGDVAAFAGLLARFADAVTEHGAPGRAGTDPTDQESP